MLNLWVSGFAAGIMVICIFESNAIGAAVNAILACVNGLYAYWRLHK